MSVKIAALDYRSTQANLDAQTVAINSFLSTRTVTKVVVCDEYILCHYTASPLVGLPLKVKIFNLVDAIQTNGMPATETAISNFINSNVTGTLPQDIITLDSGVIVLVYR